MSSSSASHDTLLGFSFLIASRIGSKPKRWAWCKLHLCIAHSSENVCITSLNFGVDREAVEWHSTASRSAPNDFVDIATTATKDLHKGCCIKPATCLFHHTASGSEKLSAGHTSLQHVASWEPSGSQHEPSVKKKLHNEVHRPQLGLPCSLQPRFSTPVGKISPGQSQQTSSKFPKRSAKKIGEQIDSCQVDINFAPSKTNRTMESFSMVQHILEIKLRLGDIKCTIQIDWKFCEKKILGIWVFMSQDICVDIYGSMNSYELHKWGSFFHISMGIHPWWSTWWIPNGSNDAISAVKPRTSYRTSCRTGSMAQEKKWVWTVWTFGLKLLNVAYNSPIIQRFSWWEMRDESFPISPTNLVVHRMLLCRNGHRCRQGM